MSELKATTVYDAYWKANSVGEGTGVLVYLKEEADAVIKELKAQKAQAEDDCVFWKKKYNDCRRELDLLKDTNAFYNGGR